MVSSEKSCLFFFGSEESHCLCCQAGTTFSLHFVALRPRPRPRVVLGGGGGMSSSLSDDTNAVVFLDGLATAGRGVVMSWQCSDVNGCISSYRYHCRFASSPLGTMISAMAASRV